MRLGKKLQAGPDLRKDLCLNALVPVDNALWLFIRKNTHYQFLINDPSEYKNTLSERHESWQLFPAYIIWCNNARRKKEVA